MRTKIEKLYKTVNDAFRDKLNAAFKEKFGFEIETSFDLVGSMRLVSRRADGRKLTKQQYLWLASYSDGYADAMGQLMEIGRG